MDTPVRRPAVVPRVPGRLLAVAFSGLLALLAVEVPVVTQERQPGTSFAVSINMVEVDVLVTDDRDRFVAGLRADDFEIYEDGKRQEIATFAPVDIPIETRARRAAADTLPAARVSPDVATNARAGEGRVYVILLDDLHVHPLRSAPVTRAARQLIEQYVGSNDLVAVLYTSGRSTASQDFTSNKRLLLDSVDKFVGRKLRSSVLDRLDEYQRTRDMETSSRADPRMQRVLDPLDAQRADQARSMLSTLTRLGELLAEARGRRKTVVLLSEGVDYPLQSDVAQTDSGLTTFSSPYATNVLQALQRAVNAANVANVHVYSIDPRGLATGGDEAIEVGSYPESPLLGHGPLSFQKEIQMQQDSLRIISEQTGGVASVTSNDFSAAFDRIVRDNSKYYMLGYYSANPKLDGRYRKIEVRVKRPDVNVRARKGYVATPLTPSPGIGTVDVEVSPALRAAIHSPLPIPAVPLRMFAAPFRDGAGASVAVGIEIDAERFRFEQHGGLYADNLEMAVIALDDEAKFRGGDRLQVDLTLKPETYRAVSEHGVRVHFRLKLPPGRYQLRAAANERGAGAAGSLVSYVEVPDFTKLPLSMSGLILTTKRAALTPTAQPDSVLAGVLPTPATTSRVFKADDTLTVMFEGYTGGAHKSASVDVTTRVQAADGAVPFRAEQQVSAADLAAGGGSFGYAIPIPLSDLPPGPYVLSVEARSRLLPAAVATREVSFEVEAATAPQ